jgi:hypothetical protein
MVCFFRGFVAMLRVRARTNLPHIRCNFSILLRVPVNIRHTVEHNKQFLAFVSLPHDGITCLKSTKYTPFQQVLSLRARDVLSVNGYMRAGQCAKPFPNNPSTMYSLRTRHIILYLSKPGERQL